MKAQTKDAVAMAMDWLAQLREEEGAEPPPGDNEPAIGGAPAAGDFGDESPPGPPAREWEAAPPAPLAVEWRFVAPAVAPAAGWEDARPPSAGWEDARPAVPPAVGWEDARPAVPPAVEWGYVAPAAPSPVEWGYVAPAAPPVADWGDPRPAAPPAAGSWYAAGLPTTSSEPPAGAQAGIEITERAPIGDELRIPLAWCEMGSCISHYADPAALGEADIRTRAIAAGWRVDALGRLACPQCQQGDPLFWTAHPVALWDRDRAVAMTALMAAAMREMAGTGGVAEMELDAPLSRKAGTPHGREPRERAGAPGRGPGAIQGGEAGAVPGPRPEMARQPGRGRHRGHPAHADRGQ